MLQQITLQSKTISDCVSFSLFGKNILRHSSRRLFVCLFALILDWIGKQAIPRMVCVDIYNRTTTFILVTPISRPDESSAKSILPSPGPDFRFLGKQEPTSQWRYLSWGIRHPRNTRSMSHDSPEAFLNWTLRFQTPRQ